LHFGKEGKITSAEGWRDQVLAADCSRLAAKHLYANTLNPDLSCFSWKDNLSLMKQSYAPREAGSSRKFFPGKALMVVGERKKLSEIKEMVKSYRKILVAGCDTCTAECMSGGRKQVAELAAALDMSFRLDGQEMEITEMSVDRQCIHEFLLDVIERAGEVDAIVSVACGAGVQSLAERLPGKSVLPGLNTMFIGETAAGGVWQERCQGCGDCLLGVTGGLCPVTRCAKGLLNGPCGGSQGGLCEVSAVLKCDVPCVWQMIYDRLSQLGELDRLTSYCPPKDWRRGGGAGPRQLVRRDN
jgi:ferredoxin